MKNPKTVDKLAEAENALKTYEQMKNAQQYVIEMLDFHIKQAKTVIAKEKKAVDAAFDEAFEKVGAAFEESKKQETQKQK